MNFACHNNEEFLELAPFCGRLVQCLLSATWHSNGKRGTAKERCGLSSAKAFNGQVMEIERASTTPSIPHRIPSHGR
jgi:hypothetical protein